MTAGPEGRGVILPDLRIALDCQAPSCTTIVTHAHGDHVPAPPFAAHATGATVELVESRFAARRAAGDAVPFATWSAQEYGAPFETERAEVTFLPAGHILGSAIVLIRPRETSAGTVLYTGDFQLRHAEGLAPTPLAALRNLHPSVLVTESTFGLPIFRFLSRDEAAARIVGIARQAIDAGETPVFLAWSLGKAQEIATMLGQADVAVVLHGAAWRACGIYEAHGFLFPRAAPYQGRPTAASALIAPPEMRLNPMVTRIPKRRLAWVSGWARLQSQRTQMDCDELVPLSDHADFRALVEFCDALAPETVVVTHGFAEAFAHLLVGRGYRASALAGSIAEAPAMGAAGAGEARSPPGAAAEANGILAFEEGEH